MEPRTKTSTSSFVSLMHRSARGNGEANTGKWCLGYVEIGIRMGPNAMQNCQFEAVFDGPD
jgi:hypothetical protein